MQYFSSFLSRWSGTKNIALIIALIVMIPSTLYLVAGDRHTVSTKSVSHSEKRLSPTMEPIPTNELIRLSPTPGVTLLNKTPTILPTSKPVAIPTSTTISSSYIVIDDTAPVHDGTITNITDCLHVTYHKSPSDGQVFINWKTDLNDWTGWYALYNPCVLAYMQVGQHSFSVQLKDSLGNLSNIVTRNFTIVDNEPPQLQNLGGPAEGSTITDSYTCFPTTYSDNLGVSGVSELYISEQYLLDNGIWSGWSVNNYAPCFSTLTNGAHTFSIQAKDKSGNVSSVTTRHFNVSLPNAATPTQTISPTKTQ